jgi:DNA polymerase elongation subunit (family B)
MKYDPLVYGKNQTERIVNCEPHEGAIDLFIETENGVDVVTKPMNYWLLTARDFGDCTRLKGEQTYKYIKKFSTFEEYNNAYLWFKRNNTKVHTIRDIKEASMVLYGFTYYKGMTPDQVSTLSFDIETNGRVINDKSRVFLISNTFRRNGQIERKLFAFDDFENEGKMIQAWCEWVRSKDPSIMLGHNIFTFDLPFLQKAADLHGVEMNLGRDGRAIRYNEYESKYRKDRSSFYTYHNAFVYGRDLVDTLFLSYKYDIGKKYESYGLKAIIKTEGLEKQGRQHYDASKIGQMIDNPEEWAKIKQYAEDDSDDALKLFDLMIPAYFYITQSVPKSLQQIINGASGSQLNSILLRSYLQDGYSIPEPTEAQVYEGATSFGISGVYKNVWKIDVISEYPSIMLQYKVYDKKKDPNAHFFKMVDYFTRERLKNKKLSKDTGEKYYKDLEQSQKIVINSCYGMLGASGLQYNSPDLAAFVTKKGREVIETAVQWASGKTVEYWLNKAGIDEDAEDES